jgi:hypothetical protein
MFSLSAHREDCWTSSHMRRMRRFSFLYHGLVTGMTELNSTFGVFGGTPSDFSRNNFIAERPLPTESRKSKTAILSIAIMFCCMATEAFAADPSDAVNRHLQCVMDNVAKLDDGKMSVEELADQIVPLCHGQHVAAMEATSGNSGTPDLEQTHTVAAVAMARDRLKSR